jgi:hypothetical protein
MLLALPPTSEVREHSLSIYNKFKEYLFHYANVNVVWNERIRIINEWFDADLTGKTDGEEINLLPVFANVSLLVISSAGFGRRTVPSLQTGDT